MALLIFLNHKNKAQIPGSEAVGEHQKGACPDSHGSELPWPRGTGSRVQRLGLRVDTTGGHPTDKWGKKAGWGPAGALTHNQGTPGPSPRDELSTGGLPPMSSVKQLRGWESLAYLAQRAPRSQYSIMAPSSGSSLLRTLPLQRPHLVNGTPGDMSMRLPSD